MMHCTSCGAKLPKATAWPRTCGACGHTAYRNPIPVAVVIQPIGDGVVVIRRGIEPAKGELALPGGYVNHGESWRDAATRELKEETGVVVRPSNVEPFAIESSPDGSMVLLIGLARPRTVTDLPPFRKNAEATERLVVDRPTKLAFSLHTDVLTRYFREHIARRRRTWKYTWVITEHEGGSWDIGYDQDVGVCVFRIDRGVLRLQCGRDNISRYVAPETANIKDVYGAIEGTMTLDDVEDALTSCTEIQRERAKIWSVAITVRSGTMESQELCLSSGVEGDAPPRKIEDLEHILREAHTVFRIANAPA